MECRERIAELGLSVATRWRAVFTQRHGQVESASELADWILADKLNVRFQMQLHKLLWGNGARQMSASQADASSATARRRAALRRTRFGHRARAGT